MTDEELMLIYTKGDDPEAFNELYKRYSARVYSYLMKNCFNPKDAEEIHQNVFLKIHNSRSSYNSKYPFSAWLFSIVKSTMIDDFRKTKSRAKVLNEFEIPKIDETISEEPLVLPVSLDESQQKLLELRYLEEWSFEEIAREFKVNAATIRKRISRLLLQLKGEV